MRVAGESDRGRGGSACSGLHGDAGLSTRGLDGGHYSEEQAGEQGECGRESEDAPVEREFHEDLALLRAEEGDESAAKNLRECKAGECSETLRAENFRRAIDE